MSLYTQDTKAVKYDCGNLVSSVLLMYLFQWKHYMHISLLRYFKINHVMFTLEH